VTFRKVLKHRRSIVRSIKLLISLQRMDAAGLVIKTSTHPATMFGRGNPMDVSLWGFLLKKQGVSLLLDARTATVLIATNRRLINEYHIQSNCF
jgi:hypothetical protein